MQHTNIREGKPAAAVWFLYSEQREPLGQIYRGEGKAVPEVGAKLTDGGKWRTAEVVEFEELRSACAMRRFSVVVRVVG